MERRDWSLKALNELIYIDSLPENERASGLARWATNYLTDHNISEFDLELEQLKQLEELFFKNVSFLTKHREEIRLELQELNKLRKFLKH